MTTAPTTRRRTSSTPACSTAWPRTGAITRCERSIARGLSEEELQEAIVNLGSSYRVVGEPGKAVEVLSRLLGNRAARVFLATGPGAASRPVAAVYGKDCGTVLQETVARGLLDQKITHRLRIDPAFPQCGVEAHLAAAVRGSQTQVDQRGDVTCGEDSVGRPGKGIGALIRAAVEPRSKLPRRRR